MINNLQFWSNKYKNKETQISREELNRIVELSLNPELIREGKVLEQ